MWGQMDPVREIIKIIIVNIFGRYISEREYRKFENNVVSFDVFDTLIFRKSGKPTAIFDIIENKCGLKGFADIRIRCEKEARKQKNYEVTLDEIYEQIGVEAGNDVASEIKRYEIETELVQCEPNEEIVALYKHLIKRKALVYLISDMYLPATVIAEMLKKCGIEGYEKLYVSSEYGSTKRNGGLFEKVITENRIDRKRMIHIGDHPLADWLIPMRKCGIKAFLYRV